MGLTLETTIQNNHIVFVWIKMINLLPMIDTTEKFGTIKLAQTMDGNQKIMWHSGTYGGKQSSSYGAGYVRQHCFNKEPNAFCRKYDHYCRRSDFLKTICAETCKAC